jgi:hypothetical protein
LSRPPDEVKAKTKAKLSISPGLKQKKGWRKAGRVWTACLRPVSIPPCSIPIGA